MDSRYLIVKRARDRITDPSRWCTNAQARNIGGQRVAPAATDAVRWCAYGALRVEALDDANTALGLYDLMYTWSEDDDDTLPTINDKYGHGPVLAYLDKATARLALCTEVNNA